MDTDNKTFLVAKGGKGAKGNHDDKRAGAQRVGQDGEIKVLV